MGNRYTELMFTNAVRAQQQAHGSREAYAAREGGPARNHLIGPAEAAFIAQRDSFYMASIGEGGWPYIQHRGGPRGFLRVLDESTLGFADFAGNRQYLSLAHVEHEPRVSLFLMDYAARRRLKLLGHAATTTDAAVIADLTPAGNRARIERAWLIRVEAFDWNCPQHITPRFTEAEIQAAVAPLHARIAELEAMLPSGGSPAREPAA